MAANKGKKMVQFFFGLGAEKCCKQQIFGYFAAFEKGAK